MDEHSFLQALKDMNIIVNDIQIEQFNTYYQLLVEWNQKVNLTAITNKDAVFEKHFYDSISPSFFFPFTSETHVCDVGAGAGFPSIPLRITYPEIHVTIVDSLKKRIHFLEELVYTLQLENVTLIHGRVEDIGSNTKYREKFSVVTARAVANLAVLAEYCLPLCEIDGAFIALKGMNAQDELDQAEKSIRVLGGKTAKTHSFQLPSEQSERSLIYIQKEKKTPKKYPRKAGTPAKKPIL